MNDEGERQRRFRDADEQNTARRAGVLGVKYLDLSGYETALPLLNDTLSTADMYQFRIVPLFLDKNINRTVYGITLSTPETEVKKLRDEAVDGAQIVEFNMISDSSWRAMMARYDPPKDVVYDNVEIAKEGDSLISEFFNLCFRSGKRNSVHGPVNIFIKKKRNNPELVHVSS
jgi:hypothetical protein